MILMKTKMIYLCLMICLSPLTSSMATVSLIDIKDMLRFGRETMMDILESWELIRPKKPNEDDNGYPFIYRMEKEIKNRIAMVSNKIDLYQRKLEIHIDMILPKLLTDLPLQENLNSKLHTLEQHVGQINDLYYNFEFYVKRTDKYEKYTLEDFALTCVSSRSGALPDILKNIHRLLVPSADTTSNSSILVLLGKQMNVSTH